MKKAGTKKVQQSVKKNPRSEVQIPRGYKPSRKQAQKYKEREGVKQWLIRAAKNDREVVVIDAVSAEEALQRAHSLSGSLKTIGTWPTLPVIYAEEHGDGPVCISWFRDGHFQALADQKAAA